MGEIRNILHIKQRKCVRNNLKLYCPSSLQLSWLNHKSLSTYTCLNRKSAFFNANCHSQDGKGLLLYVQHSYVTLVNKRGVSVFALDVNRSNTLFYSMSIVDWTIHLCKRCRMVVVYYSAPHFELGTCDLEGIIKMCLRRKGPIFILND